MVKSPDSLPRYPDGTINIASLFGQVRSSVTNSHSTVTPAGVNSSFVDEANHYLGHMATIGLFGPSGDETTRRRLINRFTGRFILVRRDMLCQIAELLRRLSVGP